MRIEGVEEKEAENKTWDQCKEKVSSILKSKLKISNAKIERARGVPGRKRSHNKDNPSTIFFKFYSHEDKESIMQNVNKSKDTGYYINKDFSKATFNVRTESWDELK